MLTALNSNRGMVVAPHHLAAQSGLAILREGGNAVEAVVAAAATIAVVYPHMNSIGGDGFWLIAEPGQEPVGIEACGAAAAEATAAFYASQGHRTIPARGPVAALTVAGTVSGWTAALRAASRWGKPLPLALLLSDAIAHAEEGVPLTAAHCTILAEKHTELTSVLGFDGTFARDGRPESGAIHRNVRLGSSLRRLAEAGLADFYCGDLARSIAADLEEAGSPLRLCDFETHEARVVTPLVTLLDAGEAFNLPPPSQGLASLLILALYDRMKANEPGGFDHIHRLVEATKIALCVRDRAVTDPRYASEEAAAFLTPGFIAAKAAEIDRARAAPWSRGPDRGDTVWLGAVDRHGRAVSFIQSTYWEFGSGVVLPETGINWQNRGTSFSLDSSDLNPLMPGRKPFHTLNPAFARLKNGRAMVYGAMGGDGQPQTQAAIFSRFAFHGEELQAAITAPRFLLGRTWGETSTTLKVEARFPPDVIAALRKAGHDVEIMGAFTSVVGHAGAIVRDTRGVLWGAFDPRSDGAVAAF